MGRDFTTPTNYSPALCDLCGSSEARVILDKPAPRAMRGDNQIVSQPLRKMECTRCGLVRDGNAYTPEALTGLYANDYSLDANADEYQFLTRAGSRPRSKVLYDWIWQSIGLERQHNINSILEVGCGAGYLLQRMQANLSWAECVGIEFSNAAREIAIQRGCRVVGGGLAEISKNQFDLIYAVTVLEHVARPSEFLSQLHARLSVDGLLVLAQPTQDVISPDIYFAEHLHHFGTDHLKMYAHKVGFTELVKIVGHELMPNFSLHGWQKAQPSSPPIIRGQTCCEESVAKHEADFARVNEILREIELDPQRSLAVFGLNERYSLLAAYSQLGNAKIICGLSDVESNVAVDFPVVKPELVTRFPVTDVLLCVNKVHLPFVSQRMAEFNLAVHPI